MTHLEKIFYTEWKTSSDLEYANRMKEEYRILAMQRLIDRFHEYHESLKMFPLINLN